MWESLDATPSGKSFDIETKIQILAIAIGKDSDKLRDLLYVAEVEELFDAWIKLQVDDMPDVDLLSRTLIKQMFDDNETIMDGIRAKHSESVSKFYGDSITNLTDGQLAYYQCLISAYDEVKGNSSEGTKLVSKKWLDGNLRN